MSTNPYPQEEPTLAERMACLREWLQSATPQQIHEAFAHVATGYSVEEATHLARLDSWWG